jgi:hypothetical protein
VFFGAQGLMLKKSVAIRLQTLKLSSFKSIFYNGEFDPGSG